MAFGQTKSDNKSAVDGVSLEIIQGRLKQIDDLRDVDGSQRVKIREYYQQAIRELESAKTWATGATV